MSVEAVSWVLNEAPDVPPQLVATLIGLANHASPDGRGCYPSQAKLCQYTRKQPRTIRTDLVELQKLGLIRHGDQRLAQHLPPDKRPVVYDLVMSPATKKTGRSSTTGRLSTAARSSGTPRPSKAAAGGRTQPVAGGRVRPVAGGRVRPPNRPVEPTTEPKNTPPPTAGPPKGATTDRGTRLPDEFLVTPDMAAWARENAPNCGTADHEAFCDYWRSAPGAKGRKTDWVATWRNWMRREQERRTVRPTANGRRPTADDRIAEIQALKSPPTEQQRPLNLIRGELA